MGAREEQQRRGSGSGPLVDPRRLVDGTRGRGRRRPVVRLTLFGLAVVIVLLALAAGPSTIGSTVELTAVAVLLFGLAIAVVIAEPAVDLDRAGSSTGTTTTAQRAEHALAGLDRIEHRRVELGRPWPQLVVGPTGVTLVDVCPYAPAEVAVIAGRIRDVASDGVPVPGCTVSVDSLEALRAHVHATGHADRVPIRAIAVVPDSTVVRADATAIDDLLVVHAAHLPDALARGPVLPMATVHAVFDRLARLPAMSSPLGGD